ncbi:MAG: ABC transporter ATP-binding protein [Pseudomonadota bacterium]|nr:ABC transporter ATP-binding protein [Pseudomonadota bacterium]
MGFLSIKEASFGYKREETVVNRVSWAIQRGEFHCLVGRSGCGKTTLLKVAAGLLQPTSGSIFIKGQRVPEPSADVGFVFQAPNLLEWLSVIDNILLPISIKLKPRVDHRKYAMELLDLVGLSAFYNRHPRELSGGQQSRVAIARALITKPEALLLDEPFAAIDAITREELQEDLLQVCGLRKTTVLFVTHDITEAVYLADRVAVMDEGRLKHSLKVNFERPREKNLRYSAHFNELCLLVRQAMDEEA